MTLLLGPRPYLLAIALALHASVPCVAAEVCLQSSGDETCLLQTSMNAQTRRQSDYPVVEAEDHLSPRVEDAASASPHRDFREKIRRDAEKRRQLRITLDPAEGRQKPRQAPGSRNLEFPGLTPALLFRGPGSHAVPEFEINLDQPPETRFLEVARRFNDSYWALYQMFRNSTRIHRWAQNSAVFRPNEDPELMREIRGISQLTRLPEYWLQSHQIHADFQSVKGPYFMYLHSQNLSLPPDEDVATGVAAYPDEVLNIPEFVQNVLKLPTAITGMSPAEFNDVFSLGGLFDVPTGMFPQFGCTGIIARDENDGTVWHARNLDFSFSHWVQNLTYNAKFTKNGKELFIGQMVFPYQAMNTGMRRGSNGYTFAHHARYFENQWDPVRDMIGYLYKEGRPPSGWGARKILEHVDNYEDAVKAFSKRKLSGREYNILSGVKKGIVIAREPDNVHYTMELNRPTEEDPLDLAVERVDAAAKRAGVELRSFAKPLKVAGQQTEACVPPRECSPSDDRYLLMTNFDYTKDDLKEYVKPPRVMYLTRRVKAQKLLNESHITPELLQHVLNDGDVMETNTLFQAMMNVEKDIYNTSLPHCADCDCGMECVHSVNFLSEGSVSVEFKP